MELEAKQDAETLHTITVSVQRTPQAMVIGIVAGYFNATFTVYVDLYCDNVTGASVVHVSVIRVGVGKSSLNHESCGDLVRHLVDCLAW